MITDKTALKYIEKLIPYFRAKCRLFKATKLNTCTTRDCNNCALNINDLHSKDTWILIRDEESINDNR